ncbi:hypothetical protein H8D36_02385 [archaeon]|nr:hypothetical protein [archaeon]MBL7057225.1 hypothetical protein [Candidatus Woesearchaeota archaeon]
MSKKRGQITIFIILGFVLIVTFAFLLFARSTILQGQLQTQAEIVVREAIESSNINIYVESCLDRIGDDAIYLLSLQGGRLYTSQGGSFPDPNPADLGKNYLTFNFSQSFHNISFYNSSNVSYGILPNLNSSCLYLSLPGYPFFNTSLDMIKSKYHNKSVLTGLCGSDTGAFGVFSLPPLCDPTGSNRINVTGNNQSFYRFGSCKFGYGDNSVQVQLETYISNAIKSCVDFTVFENYGYNISVLNEPNTTVTFADEYFIASVQYPLYVQLRRSRFKTHASFDSKRDIRFKQFYEYIQSLLQKEYKDINFDIESGYDNTFMGWDQAISLLRVSNPCVGCSTGIYDDLFQMVDNKTTIRGSPLVFLFYVKNRAPVVDWIKSGQKYDIVVREGQEIRIDPFGKDPDENFVSYYYSGWKEDINSSFDETGCAVNIVACQNNPALFVENEEMEVKNWSQSQVYKDTWQNASYRTSRQDMGLHYTLVHVRDEQGLEDFQNISIMVTDIPVVIPSGTNPFIDVGSRNASLEDPYILDAVAMSYFTNILEFEWADEAEPFNIITDMAQTIIPTDAPNIETIDSEIFEVFLSHNITLRGKFDDNGVETWTTASVFPIVVHECLPHRDDAAPYPYNDFSEDNGMVDYVDNSLPFQADHTCCNDNFEVVSGINCYEYTDYGSYFNLDLNKFSWGTYNPEAEINNNWIEFGMDGLANSDDRTNDIFERSFTRECDGSRGNVCKGPAEQTITIHACPNFVAGLEERCVGPDLDYRSTFPTTRNNLGCENYEYTTFELAFDLGGTGSCEHEEACSTLVGGTGQYNVGGEYFCNATCDGAGGCTKTITSTCEDCRTDLPATDGDGGDEPLDNSQCTNGAEGKCGEGCILDFVEPIGALTERCVDCPGSDCVFIEYYASNEHIDRFTPQVKETCAERNYDPDEFYNICKSAPGCAGNGFVYNSTWLPQDKRCCGDDDETFKAANAYSQEFCCYNSNDCTFNENCYVDTTDTEDVNGDGVNDICSGGSWTIN